MGGSGLWYHAVRNGIQRRGIEEMLKDILAFLGGFAWLILRFLLIIALSAGALYCFGTMFMFRFVWDGAIRLAIAAACGLAAFGIIRLTRDRDDDGGTDDLSGRMN